MEEVVGSIPTRSTNLFKVSSLPSVCPMRHSFMVPSPIWREHTQKSTEDRRGTKGITSPQNTTSRELEARLLVGGHGWPDPWGGAYRVWRKK